MLVLGTHIHTPEPQVYIQDLPKFSHIYHLNDLQQHIALLRQWLWKLNEMYIPKMG